MELQNEELKRDRLRGITASGNWNNLSEIFMHLKSISK